ncbi:unnamed protein product [Thlaspi arvense]|uniref:S-locus receptor kinase C-terminal domain-containing protein n=1 Tax=Thlaspi arvense TaxID=13288 RepID=A0AAU9S2J5_THLAR|nr:unnamed protein product [Thlaspi arvense]
MADVERRERVGSDGSIDEGFVRPDEFLRYMHVGLLCVQEDAYDRPTMSSVAVMLKSETVTLCQPEKPAFFAGDSQTPAN